MATCKNCLHYDLCKYIAYQEAHKNGTISSKLITIDNRIPCTFFKEEKHGYWMLNKHPEPDEKLYFCPFCTIGESDSDKDNFCPYCGRKMDMKKEGDR